MVALTRSNHLMENRPLQIKQEISEWLRSDWKIAPYSNFKLQSFSKYFENV